MKLLGALIWYTLGIPVIVGGFCMMLKNPVAGLSILLTGILLLPFTSAFLATKTNRNYGWKTRLLILFLGLAASGMIGAAEDEAKKDKAAIELARRNESKSDSLALLAEKLISTGEVDSARALVAEANRIHKAKSSKASTLQRGLNIYEDEIESHKLLVGLSDEQFSKLKNESLQDAFVSNAELNRLLIENMYENRTKRTVFIREKKERLAKIEREWKAKKLAEKRRRQTALANMRKKVDEMEGTTWYRDKISPRYTNCNGFFLYFGKKGESTPWLRWRIQYHSESRRMRRGMIRLMPTLKGIAT